MSEDQDQGTQNPSQQPETSQPEEHQDTAQESSESEAPESPERREFLTSAAGLAMTGGLVAGYGSLGYIAGRYLWPAKPEEQAWVFVTDLKSMKVGDSMNYRTPTGVPVSVTRKGEQGDEKDFVALSSTCPHLGCRVHWEAQNDRYFCPCHNGVFDANGVGTGGPPAEAKQNLAHYPLKVMKGLLYIQVPTETLMGHEPKLQPEGPVKKACRLPKKPGHDPVLNGDIEEV